MAGHT
jgi:hypothetical protein